MNKLSRSGSGVLDEDFVREFLEYIETNGTQDAYYLLEDLKGLLLDRCPSGICSRCGNTEDGQLCICYAR